MNQTRPLSFTGQKFYTLADFYNFTELWQFNNVWNNADRVLDLVLFNYNYTTQVASHELFKTDSY